jgi:hypothetical protein
MGLEVHSMFELRTQARPLDLDCDLEVGEDGSIIVDEFATREQAIRAAVSRAAPSFPMFVISPNGQRIFSAEW